MRYEIKSLEDNQVLVLDAVDWMMAMSRAVQQWGVEVSGWTCSSRANGEVHVQDTTSGRRWIVSPLMTERRRRPLRKSAPPAPPPVGASLAVPPQSNAGADVEQGIENPFDTAASLDFDEDLLDAPPLPPRAQSQSSAAEPKVVVRERAAPAPKLMMPSEGPKLPDYGPGGERTPEAPEVFHGEAAPLAQVEPTIALETPEEMRAVRPGPENLAERLFDLGEEVAACQTAYEASERLLEICMEEVRCEAGSLLRGGINDQALTFVACEGPAASQLVGKKIRFGRGLVGACFDMGITIVVHDVSADERHLSQVDEETGFQTRGVLCTPIRTEADHYGVLQLLNPDGGFESWHIQLAESLSGSLAAALAAGLH